MNSLPKILLILISISMSANTCDQEVPQMEKIMNIYWQHSYEEDRGDTIVFRPKDYNFPPSRGREGFEFKDKGHFLKYIIAPADGINTIQGNWVKLNEDNTYFIQINDNSEYDYPLPADYKLKILDFREKEAILKVLIF